MGDVIPELPPLVDEEHRTCKCGALIILGQRASDGRYISAHAAPECDWFLSIVRTVEAEIGSPCRTELGVRDVEEPSS